MTEGEPQSTVLEALPMTDTLPDTAPAEPELLTRQDPLRRHLHRSRRTCRSCAGTSDPVPRRPSTWLLRSVVPASMR